MGGERGGCLAHSDCFTDSTSLSDRKLAIWARKDIAHEANVPLGLPSATEFTLGHTVASKTEVDAVHRPNRFNPLTPCHVQRDSMEPLCGIHRRAVNVSSALLTGGPVMNVTLAFALFPLLLSWRSCLRTKPLRRLSQGSAGPAETMPR
jgi:hypothetical protein